MEYVGVHACWDVNLEATPRILVLPKTSHSTCPFLTGRTHGPAKSSLWTTSDWSICSSSPRRPTSNAPSSRVLTMETTHLDQDKL